jgi:hypothetical protein
VAIPSGILAHFFEGRIMKLFQELDDTTRTMIPHLERFEGRPRGKTPLVVEKSLGDHDEAEQHDDEEKAPWPAPTPKK